MKIIETSSRAARPHARPTAVRWLLALGVTIGLGAGCGAGPASNEAVGFDAAQMESAVREAMRSVRAFDRSKELTRILSGLDPSNVDGAARGMRTGSEYLDPIDLQLFLSAWTRFDPLGAMAEAENWPSKVGHEVGLRIVMREWAASGRVIEATNYYQTIRDPDRRALLAGPLVRGWALSGDVDGALQAARRLWDGGAPPGVIDGYVRGALTVVGPSGAIDRVVGIDATAGGEFAHRLIRTTLNLAADEQPEAAANAYARFEGAAPPAWLHGALKTIARPWSRNAPQDAIEWLLERADRPERTVTLKELMRDWASRDPEGAWSWWQSEAERVGPRDTPRRPMRSILLAPMLRRMAQFRPEESARWVEQVEKPRARALLIQRIAYFWTQRDPEATRAWVAGLDLSEEQAHRIETVMSRAESADANADEILEGTQEDDEAEDMDLEGPS